MWGKTLGTNTQPLNLQTPLRATFHGLAHCDKKLGSSLHHPTPHGGPAHTAEMDAWACEKETLIIELYRLDDSDDNDKDPSPLKSFTHHPFPTSLTATSLASIRCAPQPLALTVSAPSNPATSSPSSPAIGILEIESLSSLAHLPNIKTSTQRPFTVNKSFPVPESSKKTAEKAMKRKRAESFKEVPESQMFFTGLLFCEFRSSVKEDIDLVD